MPTFETPAPISVTIELVLGHARSIASDRTDTVVDVQPSDRSRESDVKAAEQTRVEYSNGKLLVKASKPHSFFGKGGSIDVAIELPTGSQVHGSGAAADFSGEGHLGQCRFETASGDIRLEQTGTLHLTTATGNISVDHAVGNAEVTAGSGEVRIGEVDGSATIKNANGDTRVGEITGDVRLNAANGNIVVDRARASVVAKTANGSVRVGEVASGSVVVETAFGELEVGIREGTAAWLDARSRSGSVHNSLEASDGPEQSDSTVKVRARTSFGDIVIRRAGPRTSQHE
jgi:DUF4097 and DUF4098 domain-containing protein YvlB